jgi:hypothetical protein
MRHGRRISLNKGRGRYAPILLRPRACAAGSLLLIVGITPRAIGLLALLICANISLLYNHPRDSIFTGRVLIKITISVTGTLENYDLPDLKKVIAPRPVRIE